MNVMNRKLFANRDARRKLANMGGIIASSPELLGTAQTFENGGQTFSSIFSRLMAPPIYDIAGVSKPRVAQEPTQTALEETETISEEAAKQMAVLSKARAGNSLAQIAKDTLLDTADVINIIAGSAGFLANYGASLTGDVLAVVTGAVNEDLGKAFGRKAEDIRSGGADLFLKEGKVLPRVLDFDFAGDRREEIEQNLKRTSGTTVTPEQRAAIQEQSLAAIERASPETLRDTGESVGITGKARLPNVQADVTTSVGGLGSIPTSDQVGVSPTGEITGVRTMSGYGDSGIMSQAPGISVPNVDIGEAGLENARQQADLRKFIATENPEFYNPLVKEMGQRARDYYNTDTFTSPELIYSGDVRDILKREEASPEEIQAASDRLAKEAAADEESKIKQQFGGLDAEAQAQRDAEIAEQQAMLDEDDATLNPSQKIVKEFQRQVDVLKKERADRKKVEEDQGFYTEEDEKIPVKDPEFQELLKGPFDKDSSQEEDSEKVIEKLDKAVDKENKKTGGGSPANAGANVFLDAAGIDSSNMTLKEKVTSMKEIYTDLLGYDDEEESELFWLNMAQIGFLVASGQDPNALANIAAGFAQGASKFAEDKRDRKARDDKMTLAAFSEVMADERAKTKFGYDKALAEIRASGSSSYSTVDRMFKSVLDNSLAAYKTQVEDGTITNEQAVDKAMKDASTAFPDSQFANTTKLPPEETVDVIQNGKTIKVPVSQIPTQNKVLTKEG